MKKLIVITGATSGFGMEMAKMFNKIGHPLLLVGRRVELMENLKLDNCLVRKVDVTNKEQLQSAINEAEDKYGDTDLLINNAGVMLLGNVDTQDSNEWKTMFDTNVLGVLNGMQCVLPKMKKNNSGTIINVSSIAGFKTFGNHAAYCGSKYAVHAITETTREEVSSDNVRVCLISPGAAETELLSHTTSDTIKDGYNEWKESMGGVTLDPKEIARCAKFIYESPQSVIIRDIVIAHTKQDS